MRIPQLTSPQLDVLWRVSSAIKRQSQAAAGAGTAAVVGDVGAAAAVLPWFSTAAASFTCCMPFLTYLYFCYVNLTSPCSW